MGEYKGIKGKVQKVLDDADKKAEALGEDEINARLGPATRAFFDMAENMEGKLAPIFSGVGTKLIIWVMAWILGAILGHFIAPYMTSPVLFYGVTAVLVFLGVRTGLRSRAVGTETLFYVAWLLVFINAMRTSGASTELVPAFAGGFIGHALGWLTALVFLAKPTSADDVDNAIEEALATPTPADDTPASPDTAETKTDS